MKNFEKYLTEVKKLLPGMEDRLNPGADEGTLKLLAEKAGCKLPSDFIELYSRFDGENLSRYLGFLAGLEFLPLERVLSEFTFFQSAEDEMTAMGTRAIQEIPLCGLCWIPFAFDSSRAYLAMDLSPAETGKPGQIITVDYDADHCCLLADSLDELFGKMTAWLQNGILTVNRKDADEPFLIESTGHLFNSLEDLTAPAEDPRLQEITLPAGFWQERYRKETAPLNLLTKEKNMMIKKKAIDCTPFAFMENLKELILHDCELKHISAIARTPQLKKLFLVNCTLGEENLSALSSAPQLKELSVNNMCAEGITKLQNLKTLKSLSIRNVTGITPEELAGFTGLQELSIETMDLHDGTFLGMLKNLKKLDLHYHRMDDLNFLPALTKLTDFNLPVPARNEEGLMSVPKLTKLKHFIYPVRDLKIYMGHPCLETAGMAVDVKQGFEAFEGSKVNGFTICGDTTQEHLKYVHAQMEQYVKIDSYGYQKNTQ